MPSPAKLKLKLSVCDGIVIAWGNNNKKKKNCPIRSRKADNCHPQLSFEVRDRRGSFGIDEIVRDIQG